MTSELEYGDAHIPHTWEAWARTKLKKPDSFRTERVLDRMPNFELKSGRDRGVSGSVKRF